MRAGHSVDLVGPSNLLTLLATIPAGLGPLVALFHTQMGNPGTMQGKDGRDGVPGL